MQKALQYLKRQILVPGLHIRLLFLGLLIPLEQIIVNGLF